MAQAFRTETVTHVGVQFEVRFYVDDTHGAPWKEEDGHGPVREVPYSYSGAGVRKYPGERALNSANRGQSTYLYDIAGAMKQAARDGWGLAPEELAKLAEKLGRAPSPREVHAEAVQRDFDFLAGWLNDDWHYMGVSVTPIFEGEPVSKWDEFTHAIWGIESNGDYWREVVGEICSECMEEARAAIEGDAARDAAIAQREHDGAESAPVMVPRDLLEFLVSFAEGFEGDSAQDVPVDPYVERARAILGR